MDVLVSIKASHFSCVFNIKMPTNVLTNYLIFKDRKEKNITYKNGLSYYLPTLKLVGMCTANNESFNDGIS